MLTRSVLSFTETRGEACDGVQGPPLPPSHPTHTHAPAGVRGEPCDGVRAHERLESPAGLPAGPRREDCAGAEGRGLANEQGLDKFGFRYLWGVSLNASSRLRLVFIRV